jgi:hypothetical protein
MLRAISSLASFGVAAIGIAIGAPVSADDNPLVKRANAWTHGQPIAAELLVFRDMDGCMSDGTDSPTVFNGIGNYELLRAIILQPCDLRVFECTVKRALSLVGPSRFFRDIERMYATMPQLLSQPRHLMLKDRAAIPHVLVDGIFIDDPDMSHEEVDSVFANIRAELKAGSPFDAVQKKYYDAYEYAYTETLSDGATVVLHRTRVGNYGDFVVSEAENTARPLRLADLPAEHVRPLLSGHTGDVIVLRDETEHRTILYRVRDAYSPKKA